MHDKDAVELALLGLSEGMGVAAVARDLGIAESTIGNRTAGRLPRSVTGKPVKSPRRATGSRRGRAGRPHSTRRGRSWSRRRWCAGSWARRA